MGLSLRHGNGHSKGKMYEALGAVLYIYMLMLCCEYIFGKIVLTHMVPMYKKLI